MQNQFVFNRGVTSVTELITNVPLSSCSTVNTLYGILYFHRKAVCKSSSTDNAKMKQWIGPVSYCQEYKKKKNPVDWVYRKDGQVKLKYYHSRFSSYLSSVCWCAVLVCPLFPFIRELLPFYRRRARCILSISRYEWISNNVSSAEWHAVQLIANPCYPHPALSTTDDIIRLALLTVGQIRNNLSCSQPPWLLTKDLIIIGSAAAGR